MIYDWYKILNRAEFELEDLVSKELLLSLDGVGQKTVRVTRGNTYAITIDGVMLSVNMSDANPFEFGGYAIYLDAADDIWLGLPVS